MSMKVKINMKKGWETDLAKAVQNGLLEMANDIRTRAVILAPVETGALKNSGVVEPVANGYRIRFGSERVPYARRRHFENKKNPQTLGYLARGADSVARGNISKYFRNKV